MNSVQRRLPATQHRNFRALWLGSACSSTSLWTLLLANAWIVYKLSNSSFWVGVSTFASMAPYLVAPVGGMIADRFERRVLVQVTRLLTLSIALTLFTLAITDVIAVWMVVGLAFVQGIIRSVEIPGDQSLLANVVPKGDLGNAVVLTSTTQLGSRAMGPLIAGPFLATVGVQGAYGVSAVFVFFSFLAVRRVSISSRGGVVSLRDVVKNVGEGLSYVRHTPPVLAMFVLVFFHCSLTMSFDAMLPGFAETELHTASSGFTIMTFGVGAGALVGTFILAIGTGFRRGPLLFAAAIVSGLAPVLMGLSMQLFSAAISATIMGASQAMFMALSAVMLQEVIPDDVRGRVMSLYLMTAGGIMAFMNLGFGALADDVGAPMLFALPGLTFVVITLISVFAGRNLRYIYRNGSPATTLA